MKTDTQFRFIWELTIIFIALYSVLVIPIKIGVNKYILGRAYDIIDSFTYILYVADLLINFRTTFTDSQGNEIKDLKAIRVKYLNSFRFVADFISLLNLPMMSYYISSNFIKDAAALCGLFKLAKILRIQKLNTTSALHKDTKALISFFYYTLFLVIYLHLTGCLLFYFYLKTYEVSTDYLSILSDLNFFTDNGDGTWNYDVVESFMTNEDSAMGKSYYIEYFKTKAELLAVKQFHDTDFGDTGYPLNSYVAWVPPFDNFDGTEKFWCLFEKTRIPEELSVALGWEQDQLCKDDMVSSVFIWMVSIYYSLLVVGGNELQPA